MASETVPDFEDLQPVSVSDDGEESEIITLEPGEHIVGEVRTVEHDIGQYDNTLITLSRGIGDTVRMWSCTSINRQLDAAGLGPGDVIGVQKGDEQESFENDAGESVEYYPYEVRSL